MLTPVPTPLSCPAGHLCRALVFQMRAVRTNHPAFLTPWRFFLQMEIMAATSGLRRTTVSAACLACGNSQGVRALSCPCRLLPVALQEAVLALSLWV